MNETFVDDASGADEDEYDLASLITHRPLVRAISSSSESGDSAESIQIGDGRVPMTVWQSILGASRLPVSGGITLTV